MPLYRYSAISEGGKKHFGYVDADSLAGAKERLRENNIIAVKVFSAKQSQTKVTLPTTTLLSFSRDLHHLLRSGLPLYESLLSIEEKYKKSKYHPLFLQISDMVKQGNSLSIALSCYPKIFDPIYIAMVKSGESSATLEKTFSDLFEMIERKEKWKKRLIDAVMYPAFLLTFCSVILLGLFLFLIPSMKELFEGRELALFTQIVLNISDSFQTHLPLLASIPIGTALLIFLSMRNKTIKLALSSLFFKIPLIKKVSVQSMLMRFCRVFAALLEGSVPTLEALRLSKKVVKNPQMEEAFTRVLTKVERGEKLSLGLSQEGLIPKMVTRMLKTGEESGQMTQMLHNISLIYEEEVDTTLKQMTNLLQPLLLFAIGLIVGVVLLAVLLPLTDVSSFI